MNQPQQNQQSPPPAQQPKRKFRWHIFAGIPLTVLAFFIFKSNINSSYTFDALMEKMEIIHQAKYARLACFCILCTGTVLIVRLLKEEE